MTPNEISMVITSGIGIGLSALFRYAPRLKQWYESLPHQGAAMIGMVTGASAAYFGFACTPLAGPLGVQVSCTITDAFNVGKAIFIALGTNLLTYQGMPKSPELLGIRYARGMRLAMKLNLLAPPQGDKNAHA